MKIKVIIDPISNIYYTAFYINGLKEKFGSRNVKFDASSFIHIPNRAVNLNFIVMKDGRETKYTIHVDDPYSIKRELYDWCDVYGNVNANFDKTPTEFRSKMVSLVPSYGIRLWNFPQTVFWSIHNILQVRKEINLKKFIGKYKRQLMIRLAYKDYGQPYRQQVLIDTKKNYIFHLSTLWYSDEWNKNDEGVNLTRANFIRACKSIENIKFEGGLSVSGSMAVNPTFRPLVYNGVISIKEYLEKTKMSTLVFNTPAFWDCHGWKLGEFLTLGKAIISTPLSNDLPEPLVHGENIHFVDDNEEAIRVAIVLILNDDDYRKKLETGALNYWNKYGTPVKSLELMGI